MTIRRRLERLEANHGGPGGEVTFIASGVPRGDEYGGPVVAMSADRWIARHGDETSEDFQARATATLKIKTAQPHEAEQKGNRP